MSGFNEGFPSAWKEKNIQVHLANTAGGIATPAVSGDAAQDVPGANYFSESGFEVNGTQHSTAGTPPPGYGPFLTANAAFPTDSRAQPRGVRECRHSADGSVQRHSRWNADLRSRPGQPDHPGSGLTLSQRLRSSGEHGRQRRRRLLGRFGNSSNLAPVTITGGTGHAVYEILYTDPFNIERMKVPVAVAFAANQGNNLPAPGVQSTVIR